MQEVLHAFGINHELIVAQVINFIILATALWYFLYTPVLNILHEREAKIKKSVTDAEEIEKALIESDKERTEVLKNAHVEASQIVARAVNHAENKQKTLISEAEERATRELKNAMEQAEKLKSNAIKESEAEIAKLAILSAEKILKKELSK